MAVPRQSVAPLAPATRAIRTAAAPAQTERTVQSALARRSALHARSGGARAPSLTLLLLLLLAAAPAGARWSIDIEIHNLRAST